MKYYTSILQYIKAKHPVLSPGGDADSHLTILQEVCNC